MDRIFIIKDFKKTSWIWKNKDRDPGAKGSRDLGKERIRKNIYKDIGFKTVLNHLSVPLKP